MEEALNPLTTFSEKDGAVAEFQLPQNTPSFDQDSKDQVRVLSSAGKLGSPK